jgi:adenylate cyclase
VGVEIVLGRTAPRLSVGWDSQISRQHVTVRLKTKGTEASLSVAVMEGASNPVFFRGKAIDRFKVKPGEHFVIGQTTFTFSSNRAMATIDVPNPISQRTFSHQFLKQVRYRDADRRIGVLNRLPDVIASAANEDDLMTKMVNTLMAGIATASAIGIVRIKENASRGSDGQNEGVIEVKHWDRKSLSGGDFEASERLIRESIDQQETVLHFWDRGTTEDAESGYTFDMRNDWAFACPLEALQQDRNLPGAGSITATEPSKTMVATPAGSDWAIYVTGKNKGGGASASPELANQFGGSGSGEVDLEGDIKFCELIASTLKNLLQLRDLERRQSSLRRFFSPAVLKAFARRDPDEVLRPRQCDVSVLFCDLRGFSKTSEALADDLLGLLGHVSESLGVMTRVILDHGGVIGDFHGDAAMGFWGWPLDQPDAAVRAARSAMEIQRQLELFNQEADYPFEMGIGIGTGPAVAGRIGTTDQGKVTAFGPVVNLASRLESMSKSVGASILVDDATKVALEASGEEKSFGKPVAVATVIPFGMQKSVKVYRLEAELDDGLIETINGAVEMFECGNWQEANRLIELVAAQDPDDATCRLLKQYMKANVADGAKVPHVIEMRQK